MSDLFTEALKDSQKLREIAEQDAKNAIVEAITPYIREMIAKEVSSPTDFFFEQDEEPEAKEQVVPTPPASQSVAGASPTTQAAVTIDPNQPGNLAPGLGDQTETVPLSPEGEEVVNATMPDEEGKITVDFKDLFIDDGSLTFSKDQLNKIAPVQVKGEVPPAPEQGVAPATQPVPAAAETADPAEDELQLPTESISFNEYRSAYSNIHERVDRAYFTGRITDIGRETLKQRLFDLLEAVDLMKEKGLINAKQARLQENKLEFLFIKLKEAGLRNSYFMKNNKGKDTTMKSLKEFAAKLFEEEQNLAHDSASSGETGLQVDDEYSAHAADVSGVDPKLGGRKDIKVAGKSLAEANALIESDDSMEEPWEDGEPVVDEENQGKTVARSMKENSADANTDAHDDVAEGAAGFGDTDEEPKTAGLAAESIAYEIDSDELAEVVRDIRKKSIRSKMRKLAETSDGKDAESWEDAKPEGGEDESHENLKDKKHKSNLKMESMYEMDMDEMAMMEDGEDDGVADLVLNIDLPPEVEEELAQLGLDDEDVQVDVSVNLGDLEDMDDDEEVEIVDDEEPGSEEEDVMLVDAMDDSMEEGMMEMDKDVKMESKVHHVARKNKLLEKKLARAAKLLEEKEKEFSGLKKALVETNLFTAKAVYYSKFLQRALSEKALTKKALQQIIEHLDKGKTVAETKAIFKKIERKLNEHVIASRKLDGSSSKVTKPGSANLTEGVAPQAGRILGDQTSDRWKELAGLSRNQK